MKPAGRPPRTFTKEERALPDSTQGNFLASASSRLLLRPGLPRHSPLFLHGQKRWCLHLCSVAIEKVLRVFSFWQSLWGSRELVSRLLAPRWGEVAQGAATCLFRTDRKASLEPPAVEPTNNRRVLTVALVSVPKMVTGMTPWGY